jgi:acetyl/propionyl-CoA carboxylase alpha subunit
MIRALGEYVIGGIRTNREFFTGILEDEEFRAGRLTTAFLDGYFERRQLHAPDIEMEAVAGLVLALVPRAASTATSSDANHARSAASKWAITGRTSELR